LGDLTVGGLTAPPEMVDRPATDPGSGPLIIGGSTTEPGGWPADPGRAGGVPGRLLAALPSDRAGLAVVGSDGGAGGVGDGVVSI
jgi:hypothetical protein